MPEPNSLALDAPRRGQSEIVSMGTFGTFLLWSYQDKKIGRGGGGGGSVYFDIYGMLHVLLKAWDNTGKY